MRNRRGFSLPELLVVLVILGMVTRMALPRIAYLRDRNALRSAKMQVASHIATARAAAIRRAQPSQFYTSSNSAWATVGPDGARSSVAGTMRLANMRVALSPSNDSILFDARGLASNLSGSRVYRLTVNNMTDSVCVSKLGLISRFC